MRIIAEIPARAGSKRVKNKNLRLLNGKPMISYVIEEAKKSKMLTDIYVNSDCDKIGKFAKDLGVKFYKRPIDLGGDFTTSDEYNYDFINSINTDILVQINPVCPLIESDDIDNIIKHFVDNNFDSLVTVKEERLQAFCDGKPVNFDINKKLPRTQDILPIQICSWPICVWNTKVFKEHYEKNGHAVFSGNLDLYPISQLKSIKVSYEEDFKLAEKLINLGEN
jgi:CMP-N-acetylneuraminic acid synthetase